MKKRMIWAALITLGITACVFLWVGSYVDNWSRDLTQNFAETSISSEDDRLRPIVMDGDQIATLKAFCLEFADGLANWDVVSTGEVGGSASEERGVAVNTPAVSEEIGLTRTTRLMRYIDDIRITIRYDSDLGKTELNATSRSSNVFARLPDIRGSVRTADFRNPFSPD
ncbi:MAG: hypothetical protein AAFP69_09970 [Planctomycetota bacterium]